MELSSLTRHVPVWHLTVLSLVSFFRSNWLARFRITKHPGTRLKPRFPACCVWGIVRHILCQQRAMLALSRMTSTGPGRTFLTEGVCWHKMWRTVPHTQQAGKRSFNWVPGCFVIRKRASQFDLKKLTRDKQLNAKPEHVGWDQTVPYIRPWSHLQRHTAIGSYLPASL